MPCQAISQVTGISWAARTGEDISAWSSGSVISVVRREGRAATPRVERLSAARCRAGRVESRPHGQPRSLFNSASGRLRMAARRGRGRLRASVSKARPPAGTVSPIRAAQDAGLVRASSDCSGAGRTPTTSRPA
jgi:hypothetical protein